MVSIKDIATACSVSIATVSKALNNHNDVSEATKKKVCETAKKLGYLPNSQARALKTNRTYNLGVLFAESAQRGLTHNYFGSVLNSFKNEAEYQGYDITFISQDIGQHEMTFYEHCKYRNVDGVVVVCTDNYENKGFKQLLNSDVPIVLIDYTKVKLCSVVSDNYEGVSSLVDYVYKKGHRKIAYIYGDASDVTEIRLKSFRDSMDRLNIKIREDYLLQGRYHDPKQTEYLIDRIMNIDNPPTCIMLSDDFSSIGAINAFEKLGLSIPDDVSIVGYDGIVLSQVLNPKLTTYKQDTEKIGMEAARILISLIKKEISTEAGPIYIQGCLLEGSSVKDLN